MSLSLNEIEAVAKRAARGAGYQWGIAEEAAKATRWLCAQGLDGVMELSSLLKRGFANGGEAHVPTQFRGDWAGDSDLCPLLTGASLSDCAHLLHSGPIRIRHLVSPMILLPFAAQVARVQSQIATIQSGDFSAATDGVRLVMKDVCPPVADSIEVALRGTLTAPCALRTRATPDSKGWEIINSFAHRTYAPATEESRLLGAGAGLSDND